MQKALHGENTNHPEIAAVHQKLAETYEKQGKLTDALNSHKLCLGILQKVYELEPNHQSIATCYTNIGHVLSKEKKHDEALHYYETSLEMMKVVYAGNPNHPHIALGCRNIGVTYKIVGQLAKAKENLVSALKMFQGAYGKDNEQVARTRDILEDLQKEINIQTSTS
ncbi:hypothetical protein EB796_008484 [Bugula neritina]|uniref:Kinesin light chain n=1 Tax=Bugula neritina TaxID=10212 RepID=A0A7J7K3M2_BUGNE|nr:hypothetical protein EB796_008484 [Bugula neritina]